MFGNKHPLQSKRSSNLPQVIEQPEDESSQQLVVVAPDQYKLEIPESKFEWFFVVKRKFKRFSTLSEAMPYWKSLLTVTATSLAFTFIGLFLFFLIKFYNVLPNELPFVYSQATKSWSVLDKELVLIGPIGLIVVVIAVIRLNITTFRFDRRLAKTVNLILLIFSLLGIVAITQIFSLLLIF